MSASIVANSNVGTINPATSIDSSIFSQPITEEFSSIEENEDDQTGDMVEQEDAARDTGMLE